MKGLIRFYHFLGSIYFAVTLIALTALFVAAGTFLEAHSDSHLFSANFTYSHPVFLALIWGFFINILVSALRRWPFQFKHIPFLTTHLGLLMLLGGVIIKNYYGTQGSMSLIEGGASNRIFLPNTYALHIEKKDPLNLDKKILMNFPLDPSAEIQFDDVEITIAGYAPHSHERKQSWIKNHQLIISGLKPIPVLDFDENKDSSVVYKVHFHHKHATPWNLIAFSSHQAADTAKHVYLQGLDVCVSETNTSKMMTRLPLLEALKNGINVGQYKISCSLEWNFSLFNGSENPLLSVDINGEKMLISLSGSDSLINKNVSSPYRGKLPLTFDLCREPVLLFVQDEHKDDYLFFFNSHGEICTSLFKNDALESLIAYDQGFGGYAVQTKFPFGDFRCGRHEKEQAELFRLAVQLRQSLKQTQDLAPPLKLLKSGTEAVQADFAASVLKFLHAWDTSSKLLFSDEKFLFAQNVDWRTISEQERYACGWISILLEDMEKQMLAGKSFPQILRERGWPFANQFRATDVQRNDEMITLFAQQLFAAKEQLPQPEVIPSKELSAFLKAYGITLNAIRQPIDSHEIVRVYHAARIFYERIKKLISPHEQSAKSFAQIISNIPEGTSTLVEIKKAYVDFQKHCGHEKPDENSSAHVISQALLDFAPLGEQSLAEKEIASLSAGLMAREIFLETPLSSKQTLSTVLKKWEDNHPAVTLAIKKGNHKEYHRLTYDKYGTGLAWPILGGQYKIRYQPFFIEIPYRVRLHDARQINYPGTHQSFSYESDIIVTNTEDQSKCEKTISMNNVYETKDGYRFYLASLSPPQEISAQRIQIVVNRDPAKYILTYPGAFILSLGIILLFWLRPYKR